MLAYLHVSGCPCSRCRVARNYARLLATVTDGPPAQRKEPVAAQLSVGHALLDAAYLDAVCRD